MRRRLALVATVAIATAACSTGPTDPGGDTIAVGAVYPLSGSQGQGGIDEHRGTLLAAQLVNEGGGVDGRTIEIVSTDVSAAEAAPGAVEDLHADGIDIVLGSYGSTISAPASETAAANDMLFWETGAVGMLTERSEQGERTFRMPPTGAVLGRNAISFVDGPLAEAFGRTPADLRYAVSFVDDVYGRSVASGALQAAADLDLEVVGAFGYDFRTVDYDALARRIDRSGADVLFVSAYLVDAVELRRALVRNDVDLLASIGTSSSYCMPEFGAALGDGAVGLFASDKPSGDAIDPSTLRPDGAALLERARTAYDERWGEEMSSAALAGFSAAWALFAEVMPTAIDASGTVAPDAIADAALEADLPMGSLPNGSGLRFGDPGTATAGDNVAAAAVIWEWMVPGEHMVVWPPELATHEVRAMDIVP
ncbi:MAG TPA: ABC transporter substrate-binding protein [Actinomycetota bacterium]|nr:ABC transporter substrate-binding protein [Actinomycetota bacterium]